MMMQPAHARPESGPARDEVLAPADRTRAPAKKVGPLQYKGYIPGLDVLRGAAITLVLIYHGFDGRVPYASTTSWMRFPLFVAGYGASGVQLFYILSGFLISGILIDSVESTDYYRKFYVRRTLRILPAYLLMLAILKLDHVIGWKFVLAAMLYIANMASLVGARSSEYGALWSLAVEEQFYIIWPFFIRKLSLRTLTRFIAGYLVFDVFLRLLYMFYFPHADATYKLWFNAEMLLGGALVAICLRRNLLRRDNIGRVILVIAGLALASWPLALSIDRWDLWQSRTPLLRSLGALYHFTFLLTYVALLLVVLQRNKGRAHTAGRSVPARVLAFLGYISYGLYLVHQLIFGTYDQLVAHTYLGSYRTHPSMLLLSFVICVSISILLAYLSRRFFEEFFLRRKDKTGEKDKTDKTDKQDEQDKIAPYADPPADKLPAGGTV